MGVVLFGVAVFPHIRVGWGAPSYFSKKTYKGERDRRRGVKMEPTTLDDRVIW